MAQDEVHLPEAGANAGNTTHNTQQVAAEMAKAFQELAKGEQTASALEKQLDGIETRIDELLAAAEEAAAHSHDAPDTLRQPGSNSS